MNKFQKIIILGSVLLLLIPAIEMVDGNSNVNWSLFDFIVAFALLNGLGFILEFAIRRIKSIAVRMIVVVLILLFFVLLWGEMAVGLFNSPIAGD